MVIAVLMGTCNDKSNERSMKHQLSRRLEAAWWEDGGGDQRVIDEIIHQKALFCFVLLFFGFA